MDNSFAAEIKSLLGALISRDFREDVRRLNSLLARRHSESANFELVPPMPYSGDPCALTPGDCIVLIGVNPRFQSDKRSKVEYHEMCECAKIAQNNPSAAVERFMKLRARYFSPDSDIYYGRYFTRLGNCLRARWFTKAKDAQDVFQQYVFKSDCLPWLSSNSKSIDLNKAALDDEAINLHRQFIKKIILALRPRWIQVNGIGQSEFVAKLFATRLKSRTCVGSAGQMQVGWAEIGEGELPVPVLVHKFMNRLSKDAFRIVAEEFEKFVNEPQRFEFNGVH